MTAGFQGPGALAITTEDFRRRQAASHPPTAVWQLGIWPAAVAGLALQKLLKFYAGRWAENLPSKSLGKATDFRRAGTLVKTVGQIYRDSLMGVLTAAA